VAASTKVVSVGLATDPAPEVAAGENALRQANGVVFRATGVIESRPNFDLLYETFDQSDLTLRNRGIREFNGSLVTIDFDFFSNAYVGRTLALDTEFVEYLPLAFTPVDPDNSPVMFSEARKNLYLTSAAGLTTIEDPLDETATRQAGVDMFLPTTDWHGVDLTIPDLLIGYDPASSDPASANAVEDASNVVFSVAYCFVYVKKDSNGYIRRSPPSHSLITPCIPTINRWGSGTRFYLPFPASGYGPLVVGDQVEFYRTRSIQQGSLRANIATVSPAPVYFLAQTYTITADDISTGYFVPPLDTTTEDDLGAELYTNQTQGQLGVLNSKYAPPISQALAYWQRVMWYGNTKTKQRSPNFVLQHLYRAGPLRHPRLAVNSAGGNYLLLLADTPDVTSNGLYVGMYITDNYKYGPTVNGLTVPANTQITKISVDTSTGFPLTRIDLSNPVPVTVNAVLIGNMNPNAPQGLIAETSSMTFVSGSPIVTVPSTAGWRAGMYVTDSVIGPTNSGAKVPNVTHILNIIDATHFTMTKNASASGAVSEVYVGDCLKVGSGATGIELYAWIRYYGASDGTSYTMLNPWNGQYAQCFCIHDASYGDWGRQIAIAEICQWLNWYGQVTGYRAIPDGFLPTSDFIFNGYLKFVLIAQLYSGEVLRGWTKGPALTPDIFLGTGSLPYPSGCKGFSLEELLINGNPTTITSTLPSAWLPILDAPTSSPTTNDVRVNRLYYSQQDEPEAVSLLSFFDIGSQKEEILALVPLRNALLVFKTDGLWRVTGVAPNSWSIDLIDPTIKLIRPEAVTVSKNIAYAWCKSGFLAITEDGYQSLSMNKIDRDLKSYAQPLINDTTTQGTFVAAVPLRNLVLLGVPNQTSGAALKVYCFNQNTQAWSNWDLTMVNVAESRAFDTLYYSRKEQNSSETTGAPAVNYEIREMVPLPVGTDRIYQLSAVTVVDATHYTVPQNGIQSWNPKVGDFFGFGVGDSQTISASRIIGASFNSGSGLWTITIDRVPFGAWTRYYGLEAVPMELEWHPTGYAGLPIGAFVREIQVQFDLREVPDVDTLIPEYIMGGSTENSDQIYTLTSNREPRVATVQPMRAGLSRQIGRAAVLAPYVKTSDMFCIRITGLSLVFEGVSEKTRR
jgi:hypothetical protein